ncbi:MAG: glycosyltransferase family 4 protein [Myxococcota bacterium]
MRVGLVIEHFVPGTGGAESVAWNVAHGLAKAGDEVVVVARRAQRAPAIELRPVRVPTAWQPLRVVSFSRAARVALRRDRCDCVLSFCRTHHQDVYRAGGGSHADYLQRRHGRMQRLWRLSPRHAVLLAAERRIFRDPRQRVVCVSRMVRDEIQRRYGVPDDRVVVIHNGVDIDRFHPKHRAGPGVRARAGLPADPQLCWLFAGSGFARKGLDTALRTLARADSPRAQLWVAGGDASGPWRRLARRLGVADRIHFLGFRRDLEALYAAADALFLPTRYDAFANVCLEAAAAGLPVVSSRANGSAELFAPLGGIVRDPEDVAGFSRALSQLADPELRARRGADARRIALRFTWDGHIAALRHELARAVS